MEDDFNIVGLSFADDSRPILTVRALDHSLVKEDKDTVIKYYDLAAKAFGTFTEVFESSDTSGSYYGGNPELGDPCAEKITVNNETDKDASAMIEYININGYNCPQIKSEDNRNVIDMINSETAHRFKERLTTSGSLYIGTSATADDKILTLTLFADNSPGYGTDGFVWSISYDTDNKTVISPETYLFEKSYSHSDVLKGLYEELILVNSGEFDDAYISGLYLGTDSKPYLIVTAIEHPKGADCWSRILFYDIESKQYTESPNVFIPKCE